MLASCESWPSYLSPAQRLRNPPESFTRKPYQTAMQLVREGRAGDVLDYVDAVDAGVHA